MLKWKPPSILLEHFEALHKFKISKFLSNWIRIHSLGSTQTARIQSEPEKLVSVEGKALQQYYYEANQN
jgi:hypothetical protein